MILKADKDKYLEAIRPLITNLKRQEIDLIEIEVDEFYGVFRLPDSQWVKEAVYQDDGDYFIADKCLVFPTKELFDKVLSNFAGILPQIIAEINRNVKLIKAEKYQLVEEYKKDFNINDYLIEKHFGIDTAKIDKLSNKYYRMLAGAFVVEEYEKRKMAESIALAFNGEKK
jgi:hypothetical protein